MAESQWSATATVMAAAAGAVILTIAAGPGGHSAGSQLLIPLMAGALVVVLRRWPLPVLAVVTATAVSRYLDGYSIYSARLPRREPAAET